MQHTVWKRLKGQKVLWFMLTPFLLWFIWFNYVPLYGWIMAFVNYTPGKPLLESPFVGLQHFKAFIFESGDFFKIIRNSLVLNVTNLVLSNVLAVVFAVMLNEVRANWFKKLVQTASYLPYLVSWVIVANIFNVFLAFENGLINEMLMALGLTNAPIYFMADSDYSWGILTFANVWKSLGWNAIIYIAAIAGINTEFYDAAEVDGAGRFGKIWHVMLPGIVPTITVVLLMNAGLILNTGFEQYYLLGNSMTLNYTDVIDTYTIRYGLEQGLLSYATAIGVFRSVISLSILLIVNGFAKKYTDNSLF